MDRKRKKTTDDGAEQDGQQQQEEEEPGEDEDEDEAEAEAETEAENENAQDNMEGFMCFSSLQTVLAMELCRDTRASSTIHQDNLYASDVSPLIPVAFLKLIMVAAASIYREQEEQQQGRQCWKLPRHGSEWSRINRGACHLDSAARDSMFRRKYSMSYACFLYLVEELRPFIQSDCSFFVRAPLEVERAVALVIFRLAHGFSARQVAEKYNVGASTVGKYTLIVTAALADANKLYSRYVAIPSGDRLCRIISGFQNLTNIPNMCGAMDGTHIKLYFKPARYYSPSAYRTAYKFHSIFLQGVCDATRVFWDVSCTPAGGAEGGAAGDLRRKVREGVALQEPAVSLGGNGVPVKPFVVARHGYPIEPFCIKPFGAEEGLRKAFDEQVLKGFSCIEEGFRLLRTRWKILRCMNVHLIHASQLAVACCVLHNICQLWGEPDPPDVQNDGRSNGNRTVPGLRAVDEESRVAGEEIREALFRDWVKRSLEDCSLRPPEQKGASNAKS